MTCATGINRLGKNMSDLWQAYISLLGDTEECVHPRELLQSWWCSACEHSWLSSMQVLLLVNTTHAFLSHCRLSSVYAAVTYSSKASLAYKNKYLLLLHIRHPSHLAGAPCLPLVVSESRWKDLSLSGACQYHGTGKLKEMALWNSYSSASQSHWKPEIWSSIYHRLFKSWA